MGIACTNYLRGNSIETNDDDGDNDDGNDDKYKSFNIKMTILPRSKSALNDVLCFLFAKPDEDLFTQTAPVGSPFFRSPSRFCFLPLKLSYCGQSL